MKITRFPQSCLLLEKDGHKIVIDPGTNFLGSHQVDELAGVEAVLYTHQHADHYDESIATALLQAGAAIYANAATAQLIGAENCTVVNSLDSFNVDGFAVTAYDLPHCLLPNGDEGPQNTGYVIDGALFHPGDGKEFTEPTDLKVDTVALPIIGPDISFYDAYKFAVQLAAKTVIPIHYDGMGGNPRAFAAMTKTAPFTVVVLGDGESTELAAPLA